MAALETMKISVDGSAVALHNANVELQALVCRRLAMVAANHAAELKGEPIQYEAEHFDALAAEMRASCWIDFRSEAEVSQ